MRQFGLLVLGMNIGFLGILAILFLTDNIPQYPLYGILPLTLMILNVIVGIDRVIRG
jgi:hypothetical protein